MSMLRITLFATLAATLPAAAGTDGPGLGLPLSEDEIPTYARSVMPDGTGLPPGSGTAAAGQPIYEAQCGHCHGETGVEGPITPPVGPSADFAKPAGAYWPYATTLFDYVRRAMPFYDPKSLSDDEVYALTAYLLFRNDLIAEDAVIDANSLPAVRMPNRDRYIDLWAEQGATPY